MNKLYNKNNNETIKQEYKQLKKKNINSKSQ